jgi:NAD(P)-dependent dehydrogenase (short-subunit alcohol dehydrogenase family)
MTTMDLGITGKWALVCGASKGLGRGCALALVREGVHVVIVARGAEALARTAGELRAQAASGAQVLAVAADITTAEGRAAVFGVAGGPGTDFDIVVTNAGGPPPGDFRDWDRDAWIRAVDANMLTPIELIKATVDGMAARGFGRIVNITSSAVKAPIDILGLSNGARSGLTGFVAGVARSKHRGPGRHPQQPAARQVRHRPHRHHAAGGRRQNRQKRGRHPPRPAGADSGRTLRHPRRVRRHLRLPVQPAGGLHHRAEHPARRRRLPRHVLIALVQGPP